MALNEKTIELEVKTLTEKLIKIDTSKNPEQVKDEFAKGIKDIIVNALKSADVTIPSGVVSQGVSPSVVVNPAPIILKIS